VKFNVNKVDNMVIQAIALLDTLDKDINTFIMRVREWYSWHFPELIKVRGGSRAMNGCVPWIGCVEHHGPAQACNGRHFNTCVCLMGWVRHAQRSELNEVSGGFGWRSKHACQQRMCKGGLI
jgi:hypothetical protein